VFIFLFYFLNTEGHHYIYSRGAATKIGGLIPPGVLQPSSEASDKQLVSDSELRFTCVAKRSRIFISEAKRSVQNKRMQRRRLQSCNLGAACSMSC